MYENPKCFLTLGKKSGTTANRAGKHLEERIYQVLQF